MTEEENVARRAKKAAYMRDYMARNPEKARLAAKRKRERRLTDPEHLKRERERSAKWVRENRELNSKRVASWAKNNRERNLERINRWKEKNPERYRERMSQYHGANRETQIVKAREWKKSNPEKAKINSVDSNSRRRAKKREGDQVSCRKVIAKFREAATFTCAICEEQFPTKTMLHVDHIIPLSKGGAHVPENLQPTCAPCNLRKSDKLKADYDAA